VEVFKNSFEAGLDTNMSPNLIPHNKYIQASNVNIVANGEFHALQDIKGTLDATAVATYVGDANILAAFNNNYRVEDVSGLPGITLIYAIDNLLKISCWCTGNASFYELYEQPIEDDYYTDDRVVGGVVYPEAGLDILYFTDNFFKIRKLRCDVPAGAPPQTELDVQMQRRGAKGTVELLDIAEGGSLFSGSYQIAYQMINPDTNQFTKFSTFSNPIHVFLKPTDVFEKSIRSGVGLQSNYKIQLNINLSEEEADYYTHFRLAVLENIEPAGVNVETAWLTQMEAVADFLDGTVLEEVEYNAHSRLESIHVADIVVDLMAVDHVKTISVRQNRMLAGNITLKSLEYDNGDPAITGGSVIKRSSPNTKNSFMDPVFASKYRGHFRGEVYRYAISYFDEDMNYSFPKVLDLSSVTYNRLGLVDSDIPSPNPELLNAPSFDNAAYWVNNDYGLPSSSFWSVGTDAVTTIVSAPGTSNYLSQDQILDPNKTYEYVLNLTTTAAVPAWNVKLSSWNNLVKISETIIGTGTLSMTGLYTPPAGTDHIELQVETIVSTGTWTFTDMSLKEVEGAPLPPQEVTGHDLKYPGRNVTISGESFTLFDDSGHLQSLGLELEGIDNHPTWAKGFVILRAKRIKNILFQTPIIPMKKVYGVGALENYPTIPNELSGAGRRTTEYASAQPMGPYTTYVPRNYHQNVSSDIDLYSVTGGAAGAGLGKKFTGEARLVKSTDYVLGMIFPPEFMFENKPFTFSPNFQVEPVDAMLARKAWADWSDFSIGSDVHGRNIKTSVSGTFHGLEDARYYYNATHGGVKTALSAPTPLSDYKEFINFSEPSTVAGYSVFNYERLDTPSVFWGTKANAQKCAVVKLDSAKTEINSTSTMTFAIGAQVSKSADASLAFDLTQNNVQTFEIVNVTAGLEDTRYGKVETPHEFILTGTQVTFTDAEIADVMEGNSVPKTVEVWGGDCYTTPHLFKLTDTCYGLSSSEKFEGITPLNLTSGVRNWEKCYDDLETGNESCLSIPVPYKNAAQYLNVVLESEYNAGVLDNEIINIPTTYNDDFPIYSINSSSEGAARVPLTYELNHNHKKQNSDKIFRIKDPLVESNNIFHSRLIYSDQKVYQTSINGFDIFRVLNFYDLEETYGPIHALALAGDDLYSLQERAVLYIGIGERLLETTESLQLSVQSGSYIGNVMAIDTHRGTQHLKSVLSTGTSIYFADNINRTYNRISGKQLDVISENHMASTFRQEMAEKIPEINLISSYDPTHKQIWFINNQHQEGYCFIYDEARNIWVSNYTFPDSALYGAIYNNQQLFCVEKRDGEIKLHRMYEASGGCQLFGSPVVPSVTFVVNPSLEISKVYDAISVPASANLKSFDVRVARAHDVAVQNITGQTIDVTTRGEANYRTKILRANNQRLRGLYAVFTMNWHDNSDDDVTEVTLPSVLTKYRISENKF
jgi:hypothetical protein